MFNFLLIKFHADCKYDSINKYERIYAHILFFTENICINI